MRIFIITSLITFSLVSTRILTPNFFSQIRQTNLVDGFSDQYPPSYRSYPTGDETLPDSYAQNSKEPTNDVRSTLPIMSKPVIEPPNPAILIASVKAAGLVDSLSKPRKYPILASDKDAYAKISYDTLADLLRTKNIDQLEAILMRHGLPTVILSQDISKNHK